MEEYFDLLPKELTIEIFLEIENVDDMNNYIKGLKLEETFADVNVWKSIFYRTFVTINVGLITHINYDRKGYLYYLIIYNGLLQSYKYSIDKIDISLADIYTYLIQQGISVTGLSDELLDEIDIEYSDYYITTGANGVNYFMNKYNVIDEKLLEMSKSGKLIISLGIEYNRYTINLTELNYYLGFQRKISYIEAVEFLMYVNYNKLRKEED